jgi:hypothetical protein
LNISPHEYIQTKTMLKLASAMVQTNPIISTRCIQVVMLV